MKKGFLRFIAVFMVVLVAAVYLPSSEIDSMFDVEASALITSDVSMGSNIKWKYDSKNDLVTVYGSGAMKNFGNVDDPRWEEIYKGTAERPRNRATKIVIENGITSIGNNAFGAFKELKEVVIPASVKSIGSGAFKNNEKLTKVTIPSAVTVINNDTFSGCSSLSSININEGITSIGANAFNGTKISSVNMPFSVKSIGNNAFGTVKITCNFGDPGYTYCQKHSNATAVLRTPELKAVVTPSSIDGQIIASFYVKNASGLNAANFKVKYNSDITPVSSERVVTQTDTFLSAVSFGADNTISIGVADATEIPFTSCTGECEYKVAEISFNFAPGTHAAKFNYSSSVFMLGNQKYTLSEITADYGDHNFKQSGSPVAPTCTEYGYTLQVCTICKEEKQVDIIPALGHEYTQTVTPPTCEDDGFTTYTCPRCTNSYVDPDSIIIANGHSLVESIVDATCIKKGAKAFICESCGVSSTVEEYEINPDNHVNTDIINTSDATCTVNGYTGDTYCNDCKTTISNGSEIPALGHVEEVLPAVAPTCTQAGITEGKKCSVCKKIIVAQTEVPATGHTEEVLVAVAPTCTQTGLTEGLKCTVCNEILTAQTEVPATGHAEEVLVAVAPACTQTGLTEGKKCSVCNEILTAQTEVPATGHTEEVLVAVAPTCSQTGLTEGKKCSVCNEIIVAQTEIAVLGHKEEVISGKAATCTEKGLTEGKKCSVCDEILVAQTEVPVTAHDYVSTVKSPTCTEKGYTTYTCSNCNDSQVKDYKNALGHNFDDDGVCTRCAEKNNDKPAESVLEFKDKVAFVQNDAAKTVIAKNPGTVAQVKQAMLNSGWVITDADGKTLADDKALTTGCLIKSADGKQVYAYAMLGDVNMDGKLSAADARLALRISAKLDTGTPVMLLAADCDGKEKVTASDARVILRVSAKLQEF